MTCSSLLQGQCRNLSLLRCTKQRFFSCLIFLSPPDLCKEYVSLIIGLYKSNGSVLHVDNFFRFMATGGLYLVTLLDEFLSWADIDRNWIRFLHGRLMCIAFHLSDWTGLDKSRRKLKADGRGGSRTLRIFFALSLREISGGHRKACHIC